MFSFLSTVLLLMYVTSHVGAIRHQLPTLLWTQADIISNKAPDTFQLVGLGVTPSPGTVSNSSVSLISSPRTIIADKLNRPTAISVDFRRHLVYVADSVNKRIAVASIFDTEQPRTVYEGTSSHVYGLAVDWTLGNVYWTDSVYNWIMVSGPLIRSAGSTHQPSFNYRHLINTKLDNPMGIAVIPSKGLLFWTDCGQIPIIERSSLSGTDRRVLVTELLSCPVNVAVDFINQRIFWNDVELGTVESIDLTGQARRVHLHADTTAQFYGVALLQDLLIVTDQKGKKVSIYDGSTSSHLTSASIVPSTPYSLTVFHESSQPLLKSSDRCQLASCEQLCVSHYQNTVKCLCVSGFALKSDGKSCTASEDAWYHGEQQSGLHPQVVYSIGNGVCHFPVNFPDMNVDNVNLNSACLLDDSLSDIVALSADVRQTTLYVADNRTKTILRLQLGYNDTMSMDVIVGATGIVEGISYDWISHNVYWTDVQLKHIMVCRSDGRFQSILHGELLDHPRGITADPVNRLLYWTDIGKTPRIEQSNLDGTGRKTIVDKDLGSPNNVVIDYLDFRMYWIDSKLERIETTTLNGGDRRVVILIPGSSVYKLTTFQDFIIWTDQGRRNGIHAALKTTGEKIRGLVHPTIGEANDILTFDISHQPLVPGGCHGSNKCSQLCLPAAQINTVSCACSIGFQLASDRMTCQSETMYDDFLLVTDSYHRQIYQVGLTGKQLGQLQGIGLSANHENPIAVDYDPVEGRVYWTDVEARVIKRVTVNGRQEQIVHQFPPDSVPDGLALDIHSKLVYYTDAGRRVIGAVNFLGTYHITLINSYLEKPRAICLDSVEGLMFWTDWGQRGGVDRSNADGSQRRKLVDNRHGGWPNGLTIDFTGRRLFWCDARTGRIETVDYSGHHRHAIYQRSGAHYFGIASLPGNILYLSDWTKKTLMKLVKFGTEYVELVFGPAVLSRVNSVRVYQPQHGQNATWKNSCSRMNGGCRFICLARPGRQRVCVCPDNIPRDICRQQGYQMAVQKSNAAAWFDKTASATVRQSTPQSRLQKPVQFTRTKGAESHYVNADIHVTYDQTISPGNSVVGKSDGDPSRTATGEKSAQDKTPPTNDPPTDGSLSVSVAGSQHNTDDNVYDQLNVMATTMASSVLLISDTSEQTRVPPDVATTITATTTTAIVDQPTTAASTIEIGADWPNKTSTFFAEDTLDLSTGGKKLLDLASKNPDELAWLFDRMLVTERSLPADDSTLVLDKLRHRTLEDGNLDEANLESNAGDQLDIDGKEMTSTGESIQNPSNVSGGRSSLSGASDAADSQVENAKNLDNFDGIAYVTTAAEYDERTNSNELLLSADDSDKEVDKIHENSDTHPSPPSNSDAEVAGNDVISHNENASSQVESEGLLNDLTNHSSADDVIGETDTISRTDSRSSPDVVVLETNHHYVSTVTVPTEPAYSNRTSMITATTTSVDGDVTVGDTARTEFSTSGASTGYSKTTTTQAEIPPSVETQVNRPGASTNSPADVTSTSVVTALSSEGWKIIDASIMPPNDLLLSTSSPSSTDVLSLTTHIQVLTTAGSNEHHPSPSTDVVVPSTGTDSDADTDSVLPRDSQSYVNELSAPPGDDRRTTVSSSVVVVTTANDFETELSTTDVQIPTTGGSNNEPHAVSRDRSVEYDWNTLAHDSLNYSSTARVPDTQIQLPSESETRQDVESTTTSADESDSIGNMRLKFSALDTPVPLESTTESPGTTPFPSSSSSEIRISYIDSVQTTSNSVTEEPYSNEIKSLHNRKSAQNASDLLLQQQQRQRQRDSQTAPSDILVQLFTATEAVTESGVVSGADVSELDRSADDVTDLRFSQTSLSENNNHLDSNSSRSFVDRISTAIDGDRNSSSDVAQTTNRTVSDTLTSVDVNSNSSIRSPSHDLRNNNVDSANNVTAEDLQRMLVKNGTTDESVPNLIAKFDGNASLTSDHNENLHVTVQTPNDSSNGVQQAHAGGNDTWNLVVIVSTVCCSVIFVAFIIAVGVIIHSRLNKPRVQHRPASSVVAGGSRSRPRGAPLSSTTDDDLFLNQLPVASTSFGRCATFMTSRSNDYYDMALESAISGDGIESSCYSDEGGHDNPCYNMTTFSAPLQSKLATRRTAPAPPTRHVTFSTFIDDSENSTRNTRNAINSKNIGLFHLDHCSADRLTGYDVSIT